MDCRFCRREAVVRGLCRAHYMRERRYGDAQTHPHLGRPRTPWPNQSALVRLGIRAEGSQLMAVDRRINELGVGGRGLVWRRFKYRTPEGGPDYDALEAALEQARQVARDWFIATYLADEEGCE